MRIKHIRSKAWQKYEKRCNPTFPPYIHWEAGYKAGWLERGRQTPKAKNECPYCHGTGKEGGSTLNCPACGGTGKKERK